MGDERFEEKNESFKNWIVIFYYKVYYQIYRENAYIVIIWQL